jgi:hypothetical protein
MESRTYRRPGLVCTDYTLDVPLDHDQPDGRQITVFAREAMAPGKERADLPWLLFLQGGPGGKADRPVTTTAWLERALHAGEPPDSGDTWRSRGAS